MFSRLYQTLLRWASHRLAPRYLAVIAFAESSFFPVPVDVMLAPMSMAKPANAARYATIATLGSVLGGLLGYGIGFYGLHLVEPWLVRLGLMTQFHTITSWFEQWGFWVIFIAGFSPVPYKLFTISAGALGLGVLPFTLASLIGRASRFYLVSFLFATLGPKVAPTIAKYIEWLGWAVVVAFCMLVTRYWLIQ